MEETRNKKVFVWAAIISYFIGYFYIKEVMICNGFFRPWQNLGRLIFAILFIGGVEIFARKLGTTYNTLRERKVSVVEPLILLGCVALQTVGIFIRGAFTQQDSVDFLATLMWYFTIIYYILARTGSLSAGRSGILFPLDSFQGVFSVPVFNGFLRFTTLFKRAEKEEAEHKKVDKKNTIIIIAFSVGIALCVCLYAISQLSVASDTFKGIGDSISKRIEDFFNDHFWEKLWSNMIYILMSIPVGAYLFALVAGALKRKGPYCSFKRFEYETRGWHQLPTFSAYIIVGSVLLIYTVFLGTAIFDFANHQGFFAQTAHEASTRAVASFWSLIKVVLLNIAVIAGSCLFSKKALWEDKKTKLLITVLFIYALGFAILAAFNLYAGYIGQYGFTPRRMLSGWVVGNVILWCILLIIRFHKEIPAAQIGIITAAVSFSLLSCTFPQGVFIFP